MIDEEKKWLIDQTRYNIQLGIESLELERQRTEEFIKNLLLAYDTITKGTLAVVAFIATFAIGLAANFQNFPLLEILIVNFVVGALIYLFFTILRSKVNNKFRKLVGAIYQVWLSLIMIKSTFGQLTLSTEGIATEEIHHINIYFSLSLMARFSLEKIYQEILGTRYMSHYRRAVIEELRSAEFSIEGGLYLFREYHQQLLNDHLISQLDALVSSSENLPQAKRISVIPHLPPVSVLKAYEELEKTRKF
jgi:hypothetical protein